MSPEGGTKAELQTPAACCCYSLPFTLSQLKVSEVCSYLKGKKKLLADRDRNTGESAAHKWGLLLAVSTGAEMPFSGEGMSLLLACLLSLCSLQTYSQGVI